VSISGKANAVSTPTRGRLGAACGAIFSIALFVANGNGHGGYSPYRYVVGAVAIVLFLPFLAYLCGLFRQADSANGWLSTTALAAGITGIALKLLSGAPEIAIHRAHVADGTQLHEALQGVGGAATVVSLYPLALLLTVVAVLTIRTAVLPRWLGVGAAVTAVALAINGGFPTGESVPALLLFVLWTLAASVALYRRAAAESPRLGHAYSTASV
jgi:hypothetical protein